MNLDALKQSLHDSVDTMAPILAKGNKVQLAGNNPVKIFEVSMKKVGEVKTSEDRSDRCGRTQLPQSMFDENISAP